MSTGEVVHEPNVTFTPGGERKTTQEQILERREAVEKHREAQEKPRKDFLRGKGGKASDHFDITTNRETLQEWTDHAGAPKTAEELSESARERWLRTGELPPAEKKPDSQGDVAKEPTATPERPKLADFKKQDGSIDHEGYEKALDRWGQEIKEAKERQTKQSQLDPQRARELEAEIDELKTKPGKPEWWAEPEHKAAVESFPKRRDEAIAAMSLEERNQVARSLGDHVPLNPELRSFFFHALSRVSNVRTVMVELAKDPALLLQMHNDWTGSANDKKRRWATETSIRYMLRQWDKGAGGNGNVAARTERPAKKLTSAGKPPVEPIGGGSSPDDEAEAALKNRDGERYREIMNTRDRKKWRERHRGRR